MPAPIDRDLLETKLRKILTSRGPTEARGLYAKLGVSQATFSRLVHSLGTRIVTLGRGRSRRYAWGRDIAGVDVPIPVYEVGPTGEVARELA